uniref:Uncharacterized protein n=1 Tax=Arundo donax TaxID=35708 RepID=A0A0A9F3R4_ARUDO
MKIFSLEAANHQDRAVFPSFSLSLSPSHVWQLIPYFYFRTNISDPANISDCDTESTIFCSSFFFYLSLVRL